MFTAFNFAESPVFKHTYQLSNIPLMQAQRYDYKTHMYTLLDFQATIAHTHGYYNTILLNVSIEHLK